jgi:2-methylcitrate dehydratase
MATGMRKDLFDSVQLRLADYAAGLTYASLPPEVVRAAKVSLIDTLGVLIAGFFGEPCRVARNVALRASTEEGATVIGTRIVTSPDLAAFANGTALRFLEYNDVYHYPGSAHGHPSDVIAPILAAGEYAGVDGRELITGIVLGYQVYGLVSDNFRNMNYDNANFCVAAGSVGAGRMLGLDRTRLMHCMSMAVTSNGVLRQVRRDRFTMWKEVASGHAGRAAVFAALLALDGMESPYQPFEGGAGFNSQILGGPLAFDRLDAEFKITHARTRHRPAMGEMHAAIFAAEKLGPVRRLGDIRSVKVEVYKRARDLVGVGEQFFNPETRETADHSIPYVVAAALMDGAVTARSYNDNRLWNADLRALLGRTDVVENEEFTAAYNLVPRQQRARVTIVMQNGQTLVGEAGGGEDDLAAPKSDAQIAGKFRELTEEYYGARRVDMILDQLWGLETLDDVGEIPGWLVMA